MPEIIFTPLFTITEKMRIAIEYQYQIAIYPIWFMPVPQLACSPELCSYLYPESDLKSNKTFLYRTSSTMLVIIPNSM
jgi:hypothetical protein